jgi:uncharacterized phage protein gp47/JayE
MADYGVTPTGFVRKPLDVILEEMAAEQRATIDPNLSSDADTVLGQLNGILADQLAQLWEVLEDQDKALSREADGAALDIVGALNNTLRRGATKSLVTLTLNLDAATTVPAGSIVSVDGNPSVRVVTREEVTGTGDVAVEAEAEVAGAVTANTNTLTVIETPVTGWNTVTNAEALGGGAEIEDDEAYRARQIEELAAGGGGSVPGLRVDIAVVADVTAVKVLENDTDATVDGMPPHSVEAIVLGGDDDAIAEALFASKSGGIYTHGSTLVTITDDEGVEHAVRFSRPTERRVYIAIGLTVSANYAAVNVAVKQAIEDAAVNTESPAFLNIGDDVYSARIVQVAMGVSGVLNAVASVSFSAISDPDAGPVSCAISDREIATIADADIQPSEL